MYKSLTALVLFTVLWGCKNGALPNAYNQGVVNYRIFYPVELSRQSFSSLLPQEMELFFKEDKLKFKIRGDLNLFSLEFLARANGDSCFTLFKVINKKMVYQMAPNERWFLFDSGTAPAYKIVADSVRTIAGFECSLVQFTYKNSPDVVVYAYFTKLIQIDNDLLRSPFGKVPGIPLEFEVVYNGLTYRFVANKFLPFPESETMTVPVDYKPSSRSEISSVIESILN